MRGLNVPAAKVAVTLPGGSATLLKAATAVPESARIPGVTTLPNGTGSAIGYALLVRDPVISAVDNET